MKQNILKFICGVSMIASFSSCDDLFEPALENNQDITQMYTWPDFARGLLDNAFLVLPYDENPTSDVATDDAVSNDNDNNYKKMATGAWTSQNNPINQWDVRYHAIQYCNLFLENCDKVLWDYSSETLNQMHLDLYKGQAYALRGLHMFYLLRAHAGKVNGEVVGVPIHLTSEDGTSDFNLPRNSFKECIDQILADFDEALKYLPMEYGDVKTMPAKYAGGSTAEYNRAFGSLQRGKIDGRMIAAKSLNNVGGVAGVDPDGWRWYANVDFIDAFGFTDPDPLEICWRGVVTDEKNLEKEQNNYPPSLDGKGRVNPSQNLVDAFPMANGYPITDAKSQYDAKNPYENRDPRLKTYILVNGEKIGANGSVINTAADNEGLDGIDRENGKSTKTGYYLHKLLRDDINVTTSQGAKHFGARIRYTEIFLDYAEAANEAQGPKANVGGANYSAYDVIKALRKRAGVGGENDPYLEECAQSKDKMRELIRNERRLELCFENHRFWDLRRWNANLTEAAKGVKITTGTDGKLVYTPIEVEARDYKDYMIYGPIPYSEVLKWSSLQQNDGWK